MLDKADRLIALILAENGYTDEQIAKRLVSINIFNPTLDIPSTDYPFTDTDSKDDAS